jgi:hypothetical protein
VRGEGRKPVSTAREKHGTKKARAHRDVDLVVRQARDELARATSSPRASVVRPISSERSKARTGALDEGERLACVVARKLEQRRREVLAHCRGHARGVSSRPANQRRTRSAHAPYPTRRTDSDAICHNAIDAVRRSDWCLPAKEPSAREARCAIERRADRAMARVPYTPGGSEMNGALTTGRGSRRMVLTVRCRAAGGGTDPARPSQKGRLRLGRVGVWTTAMSGDVLGSASVCRMT